MDASPNLGLSYLVGAQAQKHVTVNEALLRLDALAQLAVESRALAAPPGAPAVGARYLVAPSPSGDWSGHAGEIAVWQDGAWAFYPPAAGWRAWVRDEDVLIAWDGAAWIRPEPDFSLGLHNLPLLGVNAAADAGTPFVAQGAASLFNHAGAGCQLKINKFAAADTASLLFQDGYSGRAEIGLTGDDDLHVKVSADGAAWQNALVMKKDSAQIGALAGAAAAPSLSFQSDWDTGLFRPAADVIGFSLGGTERMRLAAGKLGIGNDNPTVALDIGKTSDAFVHIMRCNADRTSGGGAFYWGDQDNGAAGRLEYMHGTDKLGFYTAGAGRMFIDSAGKVGVGTGSPSATLHVNGQARLAPTAKASLPAAATAGAGALAYVSDAAGGAQLAYSDGTAWLKVRDGAAV